MISQQKALIFDMDGVIIDSEPLHLKAYQTVLADFDVPYTEADNRQFLGRKDNDCAATLVTQFALPISSAEFLARKLEITRALIRFEGTCQPGIRQALQEAMDLDIPCGIASSATISTIDVVLERLQIRAFFQSITSGEEVLNGKPAPDIFLKSAERLNVSANNCLVIEDTINGIRAAKTAGMQCVSVPCNTTRYQDHSEADIRLELIAQLDLVHWLQTGLLRKIGA